jgi:CheY-like chemotaxis protein
VCDEARSGTSAIQLLQQRAYGLAFVDLYLPRIDGWGVVDFIRRRRYSDNLRVFVVTNGTHARFSHVDREAIAGVLSKPLDAVCVERAIAEA